MDNLVESRQPQPNNDSSLKITLLNIMVSTRWLPSFYPFRCRFNGLQRVNPQEDSHMGRIITAFLLLSLLCTAKLLPQEWQSTDNRWTEKNNTEQYAAYLLSVAYGEHGAKVEIKQAGTRRLFVVDPGQIFHVKEVIVTGLQTFTEDKILRDAPKPGDIDSAARTNEWIQGLVKSYVEKDGPLKLVNWGAKYDHAHARVTIQLTVQERR